MLSLNDKLHFFFFPFLKFLIVVLCFLLYLSVIYLRVLQFVIGHHNLFILKMLFVLFLGFFIDLFWFELFLICIFLGIHLALFYFVYGLCCCNFLDGHIWMFHIGLLNRMIVVFIGLKIGLRHSLRLMYSFFFFLSWNLLTPWLGLLFFLFIMIFVWFFIFLLWRFGVNGLLGVRRRNLFISRHFLCHILSWCYIFLILSLLHLILLCCFFDLLQILVFEQVIAILVESSLRALSYHVNFWLWLRLILWCFVALTLLVDLSGEDGSLSGVALKVDWSFWEDGL